MEWRRRPKSDVWHFIPTCRWWPHLLTRGKPTQIRLSRPKSGEFCNECMSKLRRGMS